MKWRQTVLTIGLAGTAGYVGGMIATSSGIWRASDQSVIRAMRFELLGDRGNVLAILHKPKDGPVLEFLDHDGQSLLGLGLDPGPQLHLRDSRHQISLGIFMGLPRLRIDDANGFDIVNMGVRPARPTYGQPSEWRPHLTFIDRRGLLDHPRALRAELAVGEEGGTALILADQHGNVRAVLGRQDVETHKNGTCGKRSECSLALFGPDGKLLWSAP